MTERFSSMSVSLLPGDEPENFFYPEVATVFDLEKANLKDRLSMLQQTYIEIADATGYPSHIVYPAGGADIFPLMMPGVTSLTTIDAVSMLKSVGSDKDYSTVIHEKLHERPETYLPLDMLLDSALFTQELQDNFGKELHKDTWDFAFRQLCEGYKTDGTRSLYTDRSNFNHILGSMLAMGVDLATVQLGKFGSEFQLKFDLGRNEKLLTYKNQNLWDIREGPGVEAFDQLQTDRIIYPDDRTALLLKGDRHEVGPFVLHAITPQSIISDSAKPNYLQRLGPAYKFGQIANPTFPDFNLGYTTVKDIKIGKRKV